MPRLATDHNFNRWITNGLLRRLPDLDIVRILDAGLAEADDPSILEWAAREGRVLLTHDRKTLIRFANERVARGEPMPGVVEVLRRCPVGRAIDDLMLLLACTADGESADRAHFIPL